MPVNFLIAFVGRSGSSYLQGLLDDHPSCGCHGEILWQLGKCGETNAAAALIKREVCSQADLMASGFKYGNTHILQYPELNQFLMQEEFRVIHLSRDNRVEQYVSMCLSFKNDSWRSDAGEWKHNTIHVDLTHMDKFLRRFEEHDEYISTIFRDFPTLNLLYEDLISPSGYFPVLDFLELDRKSLTSPFSKQGKTLPKDAILNYLEVVDYFSGGRFSRYFA